MAGTCHVLNPKTAKAKAPLQSAEDRAAMHAEIIEVRLIAQNMERALQRLGEITDSLEARLSGTKGAAE